MQISSKFTISVHLLALLDYLNGKQKVTSKVLARSIGVNPVTVRNVMSDLKKAEIINISQGQSGISLSRSLDKITFYDIYKSVDSVNNEGLFHFHEHPDPDCDVGGNIHIAMDSKLDKVQTDMENDMKNITVADVMADIIKELEKSK